MPAEIVFRSAFWALFGLLLLIRAYFSLRVRESGERLLPDRAAIRREGALMFAARVILFLVLIGVLVFYAINPPWNQALVFPLAGWLRWLGFAMGLASLALLAWTQAELGRQWSAQLQLREQHQLVTSGPYRRVRHPLYTSGFGMLVGFALVTAHWIFVLFAALTIVGLVVRVPKEEQMMLEEFGDQYRQYMAATGRFFPR
jgi:protein-S-isoprenylcysteine O-methyltransferase Ste14